jgi:hypothetical protein
MKKIKFLALAAFAMLSMNAFADKTPNVTAVTATPEISEGVAPLTYTGLTLKVSDDLKTIKEATAKVKASNYIGDATSVTIPATVRMYVDDTGTTGFVGYVNFDVTEVEANAFKNNATIETVTLGAKLTTINTSAFEGCTALGEISIPATVTTINGNAFKGCSSLGTFTLADDSQLGVLAESSLEGTGLTTLDLSKATKWVDTGDGNKVKGLQTINAIFGTAGKTSLLSVKLPETVTTIKQDAFKGDTRLATVTNLDKVTSIEQDAFNGTALSGELTLQGNITIGATAFSGCTKITAVTFGNIDGANTVATNAFAGCTALETVTYGDILHVDAVAATSTPAKDGLVANTMFALTTVKTLNFGAISSKAKTTADGDKVFPANAFCDMTKLETINITGKVTVAGVFKAAIFGYTGHTVSTTLTTINYIVEGADNTALFDKNAFAVNGTYADDDMITLNTVEAVYNVYKPTVAEADLDEKLQMVKLAASEPIAAEGKIGALQADGKTYKMLQAKGTSNYYYWFKVPATVVKSIDKTQASGAKVVVYSAYVDFSDYSICMNPLAVVDGKYYVKGGATKETVVIVKSSSEDAVEYNSTTKTISSIQTFGGYAGNTSCNELQYADKKYTYANILDDGTTFPKDGNDECTVWAWANPTKYGFMFTNLTDQQKGMSKGAIFMAVAGAAPEAEAFARIKWLDEDGNVTAIQEVKKANASNGAIYNLAGQKVNASYKGVVIKDGKKYIQK